MGKEKSSFEVGFTRAEFERLMFAQVNFPFQQDKNEFHLQYLDGSAKVKVGNEGIRRVASARAPMLAIDIDLIDLPDEKRKGFMTLFFKTFHKGGG